MFTGIIKILLSVLILVYSFEITAQEKIVDTLKVDEYFSDSVSLLNYSLIYLDSSESKNIKDIKSYDTLFHKRNDSGRLAIDQNYKNGYWLKFSIENISGKSNFKAMLYLGRQGINNLYI